MYADAARDVMVDALAGVAGFLSLHTAFSPTGGSEVSGGSPAYARKAITWGPSVNGEAPSITTSQVFDVPAGTTILFAGFWSLATAGTFYGMFPLTPTLVGQAEGESTDNKFYRRAHGFVNDDRVSFFGDNLPTGITEGTVYHVITSLTDSFEVSTTQGGSAVVITADGEAIAFKNIPEVFGGQGTYTVAIGDTKINLNFISSS